ncbi:hypothetical protein KUL42_27850 [Alteromonas sp. KUL42]|nr:hypothetical protein KUL42_27850 [Alteromonas sp. KUL42]
MKVVMRVRLSKTFRQIARFIIVLYIQGLYTGVNVIYAMVRKSVKQYLIDETENV